MESATATSHSSSNNNSTTAKVLPSQSLGLIPSVFQNMPLEQAPGASVTTLHPVTSSSSFLNSTSTGNGITNTGSNAPTLKPTNILSSTSTSFSPFSSSQQLLVNPVPTLASTPVSSSTAPPAMVFPKTEPSSNGGNSNGMSTPLQLMPNTSNTFTNTPQAFIKQEDLNGYQMSNAIIPTNTSTAPLLQPYPNLFKPVATLPPPPSTSFVSTSSAPLAPTILSSPLSSGAEQKKIVNSNSPAINIGNSSGTKIRSKSCQRWTDEQDKKLREAVEKYGARNWKRISDEIGGNFTPDQCNQHWHRVLNPRIIKGDWGPAEDQLLFERVTLFGESSWVKIAEGIAGRTDIQCRHRYFQKKKENETGGSSTSTSSSSSNIASSSTAPSTSTTTPSTVPSITALPQSNTPSTTQLLPQTTATIKIDKQTPAQARKKKKVPTGSSLFQLPEDDQTFELTTNESGFVYLESDVLEDSKKVLNEEDLLAEEEDLSSLVQQKQVTQNIVKTSPNPDLQEEAKQSIKNKSKQVSNLKQYVPFSEGEDDLLAMELQKEPKPNFNQILSACSSRFHPSRKADQLQTRWEQIQAGKDDDIEIGEDESVEDKPKKKRSYTKKSVNPKPPISSRHAAALQQSESAEEAVEVKSKKRTRQNKKDKDEEEEQLQPSTATKDNPLFAALDFMTKIEEDEKSTAENLINLFKQDNKRSRAISESEEEELEDDVDDDAEIIDDDEMQILDEIEEEKSSEQESEELAKRISNKSSKRFKTQPKEEQGTVSTYSLQTTDQETVQSSSSTTPLNITVIVQRDKEETVLPELNHQDAVFLIPDNQTIESLIEAIAQRLHWQSSSSNTLELYFDNKFLQPSLPISSISQAYRIQDNQLVFTYKQSK